MREKTYFDRAKICYINIHRPSDHTENSACRGEDHRFLNYGPIDWKTVSRAATYFITLSINSDRNKPACVLRNLVGEYRLRIVP